jgi:hypothetical protein
LRMSMNQQTIGMDIDYFGTVIGFWTSTSFRVTITICSNVSTQQTLIQNVTLQYSNKLFKYNK